MKGELINLTQAWDKEKSLSPRQESNPWPPEHREGALSTQPRELMKIVAFSTSEMIFYKGKYNIYKYL